MNQNGVVCLPGPALLFFKFRFEYSILGPKSYRDNREMGPWARLLKTSVTITGIRTCSCINYLSGPLREFSQLSALPIFVSVYIMMFYSDHSVVVCKLNRGLKPPPSKVLVNYSDKSSSDLLNSACLTTR